MRCKGRVAEWNDSRGFGFIYPLVGGEKVFVHIKAFANRHRRPANGDIVVYDLTRDEKGRSQGTNVAIAGAPMPTVNAGPGQARLAFAALFLLTVTVAVAARKISPLVLVWYVVASAITYVVYAWDKSAARKGRQRTPETTLHLLGLLGGWPGALWAQRRLRHKSTKRSFRYAFWSTVLLNCGALAILVFDVTAGFGNIVGHV
jgi:uncharacterized membrane protein YsdA (DUF1294 family)/cold shock CspA family protein